VSTPPPRPAGTGRRANPARRLPFAVLLALRYLRSTRRDSFASFLSKVAAGGIGLGVAALILFLAALSGFQEAVRADVLAHTPQVEVELPRGADLAPAAAAVRAVPGVVAAQPAVRGGGWLVSGSGLVRPVEIVGFAGELPASFPGAAGGPEGLYVEDDLAAMWGLETGEVLEVVSPHPTLAPFGPPMPRVRSLPLAGTFERPRTGEDRQRIAVPLGVAESLLAHPPGRIEIDAGGLERARGLAGRLAAAVPAGSTVRTWEEINRPLFFVLKLEKAMVFVAVFLIVLVAALALVADLSLVIASKRAEIGILGAMGTDAATLRRAFLLLGGLIAGIGVAAGGIVGVGLSWALDRWEAVPLPSQVYVFDHVPFLVRGGDLAAILGLTVALALGVSLFPARRAAAMTPIRALQR
jgi:lipoprotein-releasing system permease protein